MVSYCNLLLDFQLRNARLIAHLTAHFTELTFIENVEYYFVIVLTFMQTFITHHRVITGVDFRLFLILCCRFWHATIFFIFLLQ